MFKLFVVFLHSALSKTHMGRKTLSLESTDNIVYNGSLTDVLSSSASASDQALAQIRFRDSVLVVVQEYVFNSKYKTFTRKIIYARGSSSLFMHFQALLHSRHIYKLNTNQ